MEVTSDLFRWEVQSSVAIYFNSDVSFNDNNIILHNSGFSAPLHVIDSSVVAFPDSIIVFEHNRGSLCGGMLLEKSTITFDGKVSLLFSRNEGSTGGAMAVLWWFTDDRRRRFHKNAVRWKLCSESWWGNICT